MRRLGAAQARLEREVGATEGDPWDGFDCVGGGGGGGYLPDGTLDGSPALVSTVRPAPRALPCLISGNHIIMLDPALFRTWLPGSELGEVLWHQTGRKK